MFIIRHLWPALTIAALSATGCAPTVNQRGYFADPARTQAIAVGVDTKQTISDRLGTPTVRSSFDPDTWYYISATQQQVVWYEPWTTKQSIMEIKFDAEDRVSEIKRLTEADMHSVDPVRRKTVTRGRELTFWEQMFGNVGRIAGGSGDSGPGSGPGGGGGY